jgi:hypothetical protein
MEESLNIEEWIRATKPFHLTKEQVLKMKKGDVENFLLLDSNARKAYYDTKINPIGVAKTPREFFRNSTMMKFTYEDALKGRCFYNFMNEADPDWRFEFEVEYSPDCWYPLRNGLLLGDGRFVIPEEMKGSWEKIPIETRVGFRGPMIKISEFDKLPKVFL